MLGDLEYRWVPVSTGTISAVSVIHGSGVRIPLLFLYSCFELLKDLLAWEGWGGGGENAILLIGSEFPCCAVN